MARVCPVNCGETFRNTHDLRHQGKRTGKSPSRLCSSAAQGRTVEDSKSISILRPFFCMFPANRSQAPQPAAAQGGGVSIPPTAEQTQAKFDLAISLLLNLYAPLSLAVANQWGGPDSADKRDWFAGALSDLFIERPDTTQEDVEDRILQIMGDEFEVALEDESEIALARDIIRVRRECEQGEFANVNELWRRWVDTKGGNVVRGFRAVGQDNEEEEEGDSVDEESGEEGEDEEEDAKMGGMEDGVKNSGRGKEKRPPEMDEEGFTKVIGRRKG